MTSQDGILSTAVGLAISGSASVFSKTATAPLERVKLLVQCQNEIIKQGRLSEPYRGFFNCTSRTYKTEGVLSLWRGNLAHCLRWFPSQIMNFAVKDRLKTLLQSSPNESVLLSFSKNFFAGSASGALVLAADYPLDYARTRLACDVKQSGNGGSRQFNGLVDVFKKTMASDGVRGIYRGFVVSCVGVVVYRGLYFGLYDTMRPIVMGDSRSPVLFMAVGYSVTLTSTLLSYPIDTIRRRMMMTSGQAVKYRGSFDCAKYVIKNEGFMALMKGAGISIIGSVAGTVMLVTWDMIRS